MSLDLEKHLIFYGAYHHNAVNVAIHIVCVPLILFSAMGLATNTGPLFSVPEWLQVPNLEPNLGTLAAFTWGGLYVLLEPVAGTALAALCVGGTALTNSYRVANPAITNKVAIIVHVVCWLVQFVGHGVFEGRAPALLDNLIQALFLAPLFVWLEVLFKLGYRPELRTRMEKGVAKELEKFKAQKQSEGAKKAE
ncbi:related to DUF962 domain protein [Cephalotrichum gorgonifer]|uniref:Related to DUF962 domain protein n=1 Tax=Cephalotrichum gorgonifer TaxID=2041049 RepID=A0AAE8MNN6_9PEZI|nr:related to DUF962 domain protein [Cephalotrichum gorgonifer]